MRYGGGVLTEMIYLSQHCHHQNDSSIKIGRDESHFNVSFLVRDKVARHNLVDDSDSRLEIEPTPFCLPA